LLETLGTTLGYAHANERESPLLRIMDKLVDSPLPESTLCTIGE